MPLNPEKLMIAGGGTGGHILPGVAVAEKWKEYFSGKSNVIFVGAKGALEEKIIPREGFKLYTLSISGFNRVSFLNKIKLLFFIPLSLIQSFYFLFKEKPKWVLGVGGYASGPFLLIAATLGKLIGVKTAILEPNSVPGMANKILSKWVDQIFVSFESTKKLIHHPRITFVGTPTRNKLQNMKDSAKGDFTIFVFGGSQGAIGLNTIVIESLPYFKDKNIKWIHQTGVKDYQRVKSAHEQNKTGAVVEEFLVDMASFYQKASLLVCRAGASTLAEIALVQKPSILIPLPTAADNHQYKNADDFQKAGASILLNQNETSPQQFYETVMDLYSHPEKRTQMSKNLISFCKPYAAGDVVKVLNS